MLPKMPWYMLVLLFVGLTALSLLTFNVIRVTVLKKFKLKKKIVFALMIFMLFLPLFFPMLYKSAGSILPYVQVIIFTVLMLIYLELSKIDRENKNRPVVGKPKAKPNRIKNDK